MKLPRFDHARLHLTLALLWAALMSIWANVASHWSAYEAARAAKRKPPREDA